MINSFHWFNSARRSGLQSVRAYLFFPHLKSLVFSSQWSFCSLSLLFSFLGIKQLTSVLVQTLKKHVFSKICCKFLAFFSFFAEKMLKMTISTSVWSVEHPNTGQNVQLWNILILLIFRWCLINVLFNAKQKLLWASSKALLVCWKNLNINVSFENLHIMSKEPIHEI